MEQKMHFETIHKTKLIYGIKQNLFAIGLTAGVRNFTFKTAMTFFFKGICLYLKIINLPTLKKQC